MDLNLKTELNWSHSEYGLKKDEDAGEIDRKLLLRQTRYPQILTGSPAKIVCLVKAYKIFKCLANR